MKTCLIIYTLYTDIKKMYSKFNTDKYVYQLWQIHTDSLSVYSLTVYLNYVLHSLVQVPFNPVAVYWITVYIAV